ARGETVALLRGTAGGRGRCGGAAWTGGGVLGARGQQKQEQSGPHVDSVTRTVPEKQTSDDRSSLASKKVAPGTHYYRYRCSLPGLAGFTAFASPGTIKSSRKLRRRERDSNPRYLA